MLGGRAAWWLAALGLHALAWVLLHPITLPHPGAADSPRPLPVRISEVTILAESPPVAASTKVLVPPSSSPSPSRPQPRPDVSAAPISPAPVLAVPVLAVPVAATTVPPPPEPSPPPRTSGNLAVQPPVANTSRTDGASSSPGRTEPSALSVDQQASTGTPPVASASRAASGEASAPALAPRPVSASGAADRAQGPRVDASWQGNVPPPYPLAARRRREEGTVRLDLLVEADGTVSQVRLRQSSGSAVLDRSVMQTVRHWRFVPARQDGQAIAAWYSAWEWVFRLEAGS
jgi:protein TonB